MTGEELLNAVTGKGIKIDYGGLTQENIDSYWGYQASLYESADAYLEGIGLSVGGSVTVEYGTAGDMVVTDIPTIPYSGNTAFSYGNYNIGVKEIVEIKYSTAWNWPMVAGCTYTWELTIYDMTGEENPTVKSIKSSVYSDMCFDFRVPDEDYAKTKGEYYFSVIDTGKLQFHCRCECERRYTKHLGYGTEGYETLYSPSYDEWGKGGEAIDLTIDDVVTGYITLTWESGGGGGGFQTTLVFTATAGLSGRHCDPMNGDTDANHPIARSEVPAYGSGGYGGHGGGGGAGASTVVTYKFNSGKADSVEQIAIAKRHGYGSGGGAGGRGGDGCILIFW